MYSTERLKGIEVFVETARRGSFTAAGERLNLTNSAVGKSVARLEQRLGHPADDQGADQPHHAAEDEHCRECDTA